MQVSYVKGACQVITLKNSQYATVSDIVSAISRGEIGTVNFVNSAEGIFLLTDLVKKVTKTGKTYFSCLVMDRNCSQESRIWAWEDNEPESGQIVLADYSYDKQYYFPMEKYLRNSLKRQPPLLITTSGSGDSWSTLSTWLKCV